MRLILTRHYDFDETNEHILALGDWCFSDFSTTSSPRKINVATYHWDDRKKLYQDYGFLNNVYERALVQLSRSLNEINNVDKSLKFWRIVVGPWLLTFIQITFDRYSQLKSVIESYPVDEVVVFKGDSKFLISQNMEDFIAGACDDDVWNNLFFKELLNARELISEHSHFEIHEITVDAPMPDFRAIMSAPSLYQKVKTHFRNLVSHSYNYLARFDRVFLAKTGLGLVREFRLNLFFRQVPKVYINIQLPFLTADMVAREKLIKLEGSHAEPFEQLLYRMIPKVLPVCYFEGFSSLFQEAMSIKLGDRCKKIFSAYGDWDHDPLKVLMAENSVRGKQIVLGQHGGHFGLSKFSSHQDHQLAICDKFLSWGWLDDVDQKKIHPFGNFLSKDVNVLSNKLGGLIVVQTVFPRYAGSLYSMPIASQQKYYFNDQCKFFANINDTIRNKTTIRLPLYDYGGYGRKSYAAGKYNEISIDDMRQSYASALKNYRLAVISYNATTLLENFFYNYPTVVFWDPRFWEIDPQYDYLFEALELCGVFHSCPESAGSFVNSIWERVDNWWESPSVQVAVSDFKKVFSKKPCAQLTAKICE